MRERDDTTVPLLSDRLLEEYADGRLDPQTERRVEGLVAKDVAVRDRVLRMIAIRRMIHDDVRGRASGALDAETVALVRRLEGARAGNARHPRGRNGVGGPRFSRLRVGAFGAVAAGVLVLVSVQSGGVDSRDRDSWLSRFLPAAESRRPADETVATTQKSGAAPIPTTISQGDRGQGDGDGVSEFMPDFSATGFSLIESRLISGREAESDAMQLLYEGKNGRRISLYYSQSPNDRKKQVSVRKEGPLAMLFWAANGRSFSMIGEVERNRLLELAREVTAGLSLTGGEPSQGAGDGPSAASDGSSEPSPKAPADTEGTQSAPNGDATNDADSV